MIRIVLIALTIVLSPAAWAQPFNQFVAGLPSANPLGGADLLYVIQDGISKNTTAAALAASFPSLSLANPTASIGLVPINGSASTAMRSDAAPAINTAIIPTWSGLHTFAAGLVGAVNGVNVTGTPSAGYVPVATNSTAAAWGTTFPGVMTFSQGLYSDNFFTIGGFQFFDGLPSSPGSPNVVLNNVSGGSLQGPGLLFNVLNSTPTSVTAHFKNCGLSVLTAGSELTTCDEAYLGPSGAYPTITTAVNSSSAGCVLCLGNNDNFWSLGVSTIGYAAVWTHTLAVMSAAPTVGAGQVGYGGTTVAAGSGTCPTGTVGGATVQGCIVVNVAGTSRNVPFF